MSEPTPVSQMLVVRHWLASRTMGQRAVLAVALLAFLAWTLLVTMSTLYGGGNLFLNMWYAFLVVGIPIGTILLIVLLFVWVAHGPTKS